MKSLSIAWIIIVLAIFPLFLAAQDESSDAPVRPSIAVSDDVRASLEALLPDMAALRFHPLGDPQCFGADLYEYINGAADAFHSYDFVALWHGRYQKGDTKLTVDIYDMGSLLNAFGMYSIERSPDYDYIPIGAEGYQSPGILYFYQDRFYIKLEAYPQNQVTNELLHTLAQKLSEKIGDDCTAPQALALFPKENLIPHSETYLKQAPRGHEFLAPAFAAEVVIDGVTGTLMVSLAENETQAAANTEKLHAHIKKTGEAQDLPELAPKAFCGSNSFEGAMLAFPLERYIVILWNPPASPVPFLKRWSQTVPDPK